MEIERIYKRTGTEVRGEEHGRKRERIRRQKMFHAAATIIQKRFRVMRSRKELRLRKALPSPSFPSLPLIPLTCGRVGDREGDDCEGVDGEASGLVQHLVDAEREGSFEASPSQLRSVSPSLLSASRNALLLTRWLLDRDHSSRERTEAAADKELRSPSLLPIVPRMGSTPRRARGFLCADGRR